MLNEKEKLQIHSKPPLLLKIFSWQSKYQKCGLKYKTDCPKESNISKVAVMANTHIQL